MIRLIARKEITESLMTFRFALGSLIIVLLVPVFTWLGVRDYERRYEEYLAQLEESRPAEVDRYNELLELTDFIDSKLSVVQPPQRLSVLSRGVAGGLSNRVHITMPFIPSVTVQFLDTTQRTGFTHIFSTIDPFWAMFVVISLLGMLLSYDSFSGEKEGRSLPMVLSASVSRSTLFVGKYLGILATLVIPIVIGIILSLLTVNIVSPGLFSGSDWPRIVLVFLVLCLSGSIFITIGMVVSALTHRPATSLIDLTFLWVLLVVLVPIGAIYFARSVRPIPLRYLVERGFKDNFRDRDWRADPDYMLPSRPWTPVVNYFYAVNWFPPYGIFRMYQPLPEEWMVELARFYRSKVPQLQSLARDIRNSVGFFEEGVTAQTKLIRWLERTSPFGIGRHLADGLLGTDYGAYDRFLLDCRRYRETVIAYVQDKLDHDPVRVVSSYGSGTAPTESEFITRITEGKYNSLTSLLNEAKDAENDRERFRGIITAYPERPGETERLRLDDLPVFDYRPEPLSDTLNRNMIDLGFLLVYQVLLFAVGLVLITRYDPR